ncbi:MAG TPA: ChaN family lipoprotein, partial [Usitatibacter sp.]|nr:ChaN family lipoprotein [Usitatibacter sp.]
MRAFVLLMALAALVGAGCAASRLELADHPLAGRIWDTHAQRFVSDDEARERVASADVALLGETHDNPAHHQIQARLLAASAAHGPKPALAMEQIDLEWQQAIDGARAGSATPASIATAGHVSEGWQWPLYEPLVAFALAHDLPIVAANYSRSRSRAVVAGGIASLPAGEAQRLALEPVWT